MSKPELTITIKPDGTVDGDAVGYTGKSCKAALDKILSGLGPRKDTRKREFSQREQQYINR